MTSLVSFTKRETLRSLFCKEGLGRPPRGRIFPSALLTTTLLLLLTPPSYAQFTPAQLMQTLAQVQSVHAHFREQKELSILQEPLLLTGILRYQAPDYLHKRVLLPYQESVEIRGNTLRLKTPDKGEKQLALSDYPPLQAFVESFRSTLAGDLNNLARFYNLQLNGSLSDWQLNLQPVDRKIKKFVTQIVIRGNHDQVRSVEILETGGDRSLMNITPINE